ncbi:hypothetical protein M0R04_03265 [Candidatus Dojkabacteria bacterium]|jgi:cell shape-determining protein MreC|nr:hypothetical protein [Candidatus Dojkabacteria bacterium]
MNIQFEKNKSREMLVLIVLTIFFLLINLFSFAKIVRIPFETIYQPISFFGAKLGAGIVENIQLVKDLGKIKNENTANKLRVQELESENAGYSLLLEKYNSLVIQNKLAGKKYTYTQAEVFKSNGQYLLNVGTKDGIKVGDVVVLGNSYIGKISFVDEDYSKLNIPSQMGNSISVIIVSNANANKSVDQLSKISTNLGNAVAVGNEYEIKIENLTSLSKAKEGDIVLTNDPLVSQYLILGKLTSLKNYKADTLVTGIVSQIVNIEDIKFVYVRK